MPPASNTLLDGNMLTACQCCDTGARTLVDSLVLEDTPINAAEDERIHESMSVGHLLISLVEGPQLPKAHTRIPTYFQSEFSCGRRGTIPVISSPFCSSSVQSRLDQGGCTHNHSSSVSSEVQMMCFISTCLSSRYLVRSRKAR